MVTTRRADMPIPRSRTPTSNRWERGCTSCATRSIAKRLGGTVLDCEAGWTGKEHYRADDDQEEVYLLIEGEEVAMESGDASG